MKKEKHVMLSLSEFEDAYLRLQAKRKGMSVTEYVRQELVYGNIPAGLSGLGVVSLPVEEPELKTELIRFVVSPEDKDAIKKKAEALGMTMSNFLRQVALSVEVEASDTDNATATLVELRDKLQSDTDMLEGVTGDKWKLSPIDRVMYTNAMIAATEALKTVDKVLAEYID